MQTINSGALDIYDLGGGAILIAWPPFPGIVPTAFNIYVNGVLNQTVVTSGGSLQALLAESGLQILTEGGQYIALEQAGGVSVGGIATITGLQAASYAAAGLPPAGNGSARPESLPPVGLITDSGQYDITVVPVVNGIEQAVALDRSVTPGPTTTTLITPMPRGRFPFPNTPGGY